jgi:hypothetical protein
MTLHAESAVHTQTPQLEAEALGFTPEERERIDADLLAALPLLIAVRKGQHVLALQAPASSGLPTEPATVMPYYFNKRDPDELGIWKLTQDNNPSVYIYSHEAKPLNPDDSPTATVILRSTLSTKSTTGGELDPNRERECASLLRLAADAYAQQQSEQDKDQAAASHRYRGIGKLFSWFTRS